MFVRHEGFDAFPCLPEGHDPAIIKGKKLVGSGYELLKTLFRGDNRDAELTTELFNCGQ